MSKIYFASDFHLGRDVRHTSQVREEHIISWLQSIKHDADKIYLVGDLFDYWYEYDNVIPRGFERFLSALRVLRNEGVSIEIFTGNHDLWMKEYFEKDLDIQVHRRPITVQHQNKMLHIGHGDGLGPGDYGYKFIKKIFENKICQWLFSRIHPNTAIGIMKFFSNLSNKKNKGKHPFESFASEWLVQYAENHVESIDYFIFGHRHLAIDYKLSKQDARYINVGDWMSHYTYAVLEQGELRLNTYFESDLIENVIKTNQSHYGTTLS